MSLKMQEVLVVGAGITGLTAALDLAALGRPVRVVEKKPEAGGYAAHYCCKATDRCRQCGACLVDENLSRALKEPLIRFDLSTEVKEIVSTEEGLAATLAGGGHEERTAFPAVFLGSGFIPFNPQKKPHFGFGRIPNMITGLDLESMLRKKGDVARPSDGETPRRMAFVQCVGSRDASINHVYCSRVCCAYALRMGRLIKRDHPDTEVTIFYMDIQTFGKDFTDSWAQVREELRLVREIPAEYYRTEGDRVGVLVPLPEGTREEIFDLLVLSVGMTPGLDMSLWAERLGLTADKDGFVSPKAAGGVFAAGSATGPMHIWECVADAHRAVRELVEYLEEKG